MDNSGFRKEAKSIKANRHQFLIICPVLQERPIPLGKQREESEENNLLRNNLLVLDNSEINLRCKHWLKLLNSANVVPKFQNGCLQSDASTGHIGRPPRLRCWCGLFQPPSLGHPVVPWMQTARTLSCCCHRTKPCRMQEMPSSKEGESKMDGKWNYKTGKNPKLFLHCFTPLTTAQTCAFLGKSPQSMWFTSPSPPPSRIIAIKKLPKDLKLLQWWGLL